jgi:hypothetical protein
MQYYIKAKFAGKCYETNLLIKKGDKVLYCEALRKVFHFNSPSARAYDAEQAEYNNLEEYNKVMNYNQQGSTCINSAL